MITIEELRSISKEANMKNIEKKEKEFDELLNSPELAKLLIDFESIALEEAKKGLYIAKINLEEYFTKDTDMNNISNAIEVKSDYKVHTIRNNSNEWSVDIAWYLV